MNRLLLAALAATFVMTGCSLHPRHHDPRPGPGTTSADALHTQPLLTVREGIISVAPEPIVVSISELRKKNQPIVWRLPAGYRFQKLGIEVLGVLPPTLEALKNTTLVPNPVGKAALECQAVEKDEQAFACRFTERAVKGVYRYAIRVIDPAGKPIDWDPSVFAMD